MNIQHQSNGNRGSFFYGDASQPLAEMVYVMAGPKKMIIEHTEVDESLRGEGVGAKLLEALVDFVRKEEIKVVPLCPFASATFRKRDDLKDVLN
jgi:predicted GNAT family acetyltransferase